ncbi:hypothetical protein F4782DRAFT_480356 [Xylaria castorea]|nr:hypothetical protein F4782DRAFT_480356 [Xylaria castorea]
MTNIASFLLLQLLAFPSFEAPLRHTWIRSVHGPTTILMNVQMLSSISIVYIRWPSMAQLGHMGNLLCLYNVNVPEIVGSHNTYPKGSRTTILPATYTHYGLRLTAYLNSSSTVTMYTQARNSYNC